MCVVQLPSLIWGSSFLASLHANAKQGTYGRWFMCTIVQLHHTAMLRRAVLLACCHNIALGPTAAAEHHHNRRLSAEGLELPVATGVLLLQH
jgi:hypothetical protein